jgi:ABC-type nitrate/sulfonate/bicarbonate transport system substrate-binding protein
MSISRARLVAIGAALALSLGATAAPVTAQDGSGEAVPVRVAMTPFFDYQFLSVADELGWDEELGVDLQFTWFAQSGPSIQALVNGSVDTVNTCVICNFPFYESVPELRDFLTVNQFKGFVLIGRQGASKTYAEFLEELGDPVAAQKATLEQVRGKTFPMYSANYETLLKATLDQAGMTLDDVEIVNFPDDEKAALAFIGGTGDFYMGGLPSEINLLQNHPEEFQLIGGAEILGPAGLWYSQVGSSENWLEANEDLAHKIMAMSYRFNRYVNEQPETVMPIVARAMNEHSGVATSEEDLGFIFDTFLAFRSYQDDATTTYDPESDLYWGRSGDYYVTQSADLPEGADYRLQNPLDEWFASFLTRTDLLEWVDAPLE